MAEEKSGYGYSKRPLWQWVLLYAVIGAVVYGVVYYFFFAGHGYSYNTTAQTSNSGQQYPSQATTVQTPTSFLPNSTTTAQAISTLPPNGDVNPYGVVFVPVGFPSGSKLNSGDVLVSNWNNSKNLQGTGTTITRIISAGKQSVFFQGKAGIGLTTALAVVKAGFVIVGNLPSTDGTSKTAKPGSLLVIDRNGKLVTTLTDKTLIDGPWDMTVNDNGMQVQAFVTNALSGTVVRFDLVFNSTGLTSHKGTVIASGYAHKGDPNALEVGPTGLVYDAATGTLYVASTADNAVYAVPNAGSTTSDGGMGTVVYKDQQHLRGPVGLAKAPNGDFLVTNGDAINPDQTQPSEIVEFTPAGAFVKELSVDAAQGSAFGLAIDTSAAGSARFATVDDNTSNLLIWTIPLR